MDPYFYQSYRDFNYFQNIIHKIKNIKLNEIQKHYMYFFVYYPHTSPYDIEPDKKMPDDDGQKIIINTKNYRHAKIVVNKLYKLKLIDSYIKKTSKNRDKKFYFLTDIGLLYIIRSPDFLQLNVQAMIKNYPHLKIFKDLLYPFITLDTLCSSDIPINLKKQISLYIQGHYLKIENFIFHTENKSNWYEDNLITNDKKFQGYSNTKNSSIKCSFSKEDNIGKAFSPFYPSNRSEFIFQVLPSFRDFSLVKLLLLSKDEKFIQSLETAKKDFDTIYSSIKEPYTNSIQTRLSKTFIETCLPKEIKKLGI